MAWKRETNCDLSMKSNLTVYHKYDTTYNMEMAIEKYRSKWTYFMSILEKMALL